ncbi:MAG TPA: multicopper oxidase domain-containing protein [Chloroflexota bacterium]|nr:multicopper oxidase domain-containing protein [Chloroflexota bacterium]HUM67685.1 multicopper oxidase domain-containing protein [Chloroflexota bacterium]
MDKSKKGVSRRDFLRAGSIGMAGLAGITGLRALTQPATANALPPFQEGEGDDIHDHGGAGVVGQVDHEANGFHPHEILTDFDYGELKEENGRSVREWNFIAIDKEFEIAPGLYFPGWVYGSATSAASRRAGRVVGQCPGPTLRCVEGELLRLHFTNAGSHPHTIHFHGIHSAFMDGIPGVGRGMINTGERFTYEFEARPFGCHLYHCHAVPLKRHIHKGLYGAFIVDPDPEKYSGEEQEIAKTRNHQYPENEAVNEMVIVMNAFDTNFDGDNEVYAANSIAFGYGMASPIPIQRDQRQRLYLINATEFDPINSIHIHANFFDYYDHGTTLKPTLTTVDTIMQCQAQRGILEFSFADFEPGLYMFHAHQSEFAELGWMSFFDVRA